jgi:multidrug efflux system membrane fusion protein
MMSSRSFEIVAVALLAAACSAPAVKDTPVRADVTKTAVAHVATVPDVYETTGTVRARTTSNLAAKVMGNVTRILVAEGDRVQRGQLLLQIDPQEAHAQLQKARAGSSEIDHAIQAAKAAEAAAAANAQLAKTTYDRFVILRDRGSVSAHEFDQVTAQQEGAAADLDRAHAEYAQLVAKKAEAGAELETALTFAGYNEIRSPVDGVVTAKYVDVGSQAAPGMVLLTVEESDGLRVDATVSDEYVSRIHVGDEAEVGEGVHARVAQVVPSLDPATRTALVKLAIDRDAAMRSGQLTRVRFRIGDRRALMIPSQAIASRGALRSVNVIDASGVAQMRLVTTGRTFSGLTEIIAGLEDGERFTESQ